MKLLLLIICFLPMYIQAQVKVYRTIQDYEKETPEVYEDYNGWSARLARIYLSMTKDGKKKSIQCCDIWGFEYKGKFFRISVGANNICMPAMLVVEDKFCFYENGIMHLTFLLKPGNTVRTYGESEFISSDRTSEVISVNSGSGETQSSFNSHNSKFYDFFKDPEYVDLLACFKENHVIHMNEYNMRTRKICIVEYLEGK